MADSSTNPRPLGRRNFLSRAVIAVQAAIGGTLAALLGVTTLGPGLRRRDGAWLRAATLDQLPEDQPVPVTLRVTREDGYAQVVQRTVVYLVRTGETGVRAMHSTCTHLGCRTAYDRRSRRILCPCHGGAFDVQGNVVDGPPPAPLPTLATRLEDGEVFVQVQA